MNTGFGSFENILVFGLGTLIDLITLGYYRLGFNDLKEFIKKAVVDNVLSRRYESYYSSKKAIRHTIASPYPGSRQYLWGFLKRYHDVDVVKNGRMNAQRFAPNLLAETKPVKTLASDRVSEEYRIAEMPQFYSEQNRIRKLHCLFSYLSGRYDLEQKYWKRSLAAVLSSSLEFPEYVHERFSHAENAEKETENKNDATDLDVTVIVPAYNEEKEIEQLLTSAFDQTQPPKKVIVIDDCSVDNTPNICRRLQEEHENFVYIRQIRRRGKAHNLNVATQLILKEKEFHSPITLFIDASGYLEKDFIEKIKSSFNGEDVTAVSASAAVIEPESLKGKIIFEKYDLMFKIYKFRKAAQNYRNTVSPVCGGCVAYRTEVLKDVPIPERTLTEDTDHTWLLLEKEHRLIHNPRAIKHCVEAKTFSGFFKQWYRWYAGTFQCLYTHGKYLLKAKKLFFLTILPGLVDGLAYSSSFFISMPLFFFNPFLIYGALLWDFCITGLMMAIVKRHELKSLKYLPMVWIMKFPLIITWLIACAKTTWQYLRHKRYLWRFSARAWKRPDATATTNHRNIDANELAHGLNDLQEEIKMLTIEKTNLQAEKRVLEKTHKK